MDMELSATAPKNLDVRLFFRHVQEYGILAVFLLECIFFSLTSAHFLTPENLINVTLQTSILAIIAVGMTFVILTDGLNLTGVGSYVQQVVLGVISLLAVLFDQLKNRET